MSTNKDLLKQAIAEAKTIREAAIANAKEALEETLTPHLKEMLAMKLQEMDNDDSDEDNFDPGHDIEQAQHNIDRRMYEGEEEEETEEEGETEEGEEEEDIDVKDMSVEELKDLIRDIVSQEVGHDESEEEEAPEGTEDMTGMDSEEEIDINELLAELAEMDGEVEEGIGSAVRGVVKKVKDKAEKAYDAIQNAPETKFSKVLSKRIPETEPHSGANRLAEEDLEEGMEDWIDKMSAKLQKAGKDSKIVQAMEKMISKYETEKHSGANKIAEGELEEGMEDWIDKMSAKMQKLGKDSKVVQAMEKLVRQYETEPHSGANKISEESEELNEALATVKQLRNQLQEVNLLNAKLLYVNKVFKANNLTESQKVNVVAAFDRAETVKEVKLVFETVSKNVVTKPVTIKEHKSFASKAVGTAATAGKKEIISEVSEQVARWQKLAGIIKS